MRVLVLHLPGLVSTPVPNPAWMSYRREAVHVEASGLKAHRSSQLLPFTNFTTPTNLTDTAVDYLDYYFLPRNARGARFRFYVRVPE